MYDLSYIVNNAKLTNIKTIISNNDKSLINKFINMTINYELNYIDMLSILYKVGYIEFIKLIYNETIKVRNKSLFEKLINKYDIDINKDYNLMNYIKQIDFIDPDIERYLLKRNWKKEYSYLYEVDKQIKGYALFTNKNNKIIFSLNKYVFDLNYYIVCTTNIFNFFYFKDTTMYKLINEINKYNKIKKHIKNAILTNNKHNKTINNVFNKHINTLNKLKTICKLKNYKLLINNNNIVFNYFNLIIKSINNNNYIQLRCTNDLYLLLCKKNIYFIDLENYNKTIINIKYLDKLLYIIEEYILNEIN